MKLKLFDHTPLVDFPNVTVNCKILCVCWNAAYLLRERGAAPPLPSTFFQIKYCSKAGSQQLPASGLQHIGDGGFQRSGEMLRGQS